MSLYEVGTHCAFAHLNQLSIPQTGHHRTFQFLLQMKRNADSVLWTKRKFNQANGIGRSNPIFLSRDCWAYFLGRLKRSKTFGDSEIKPRNCLRTLRCFFQDLSSKACPFGTSVFIITASSSAQYQALRNIFGTSYGFGVRRARDTQTSGLKKLSVLDQINVLDFFSTGEHDGGQHNNQDMEDAPKISNKVIFTYSLVTSMLTIRYYYRYMRVHSEIGQQLLS